MWNMQEEISASVKIRTRFPLRTAGACGTVSTVGSMVLPMNERYHMRQFRIRNVGTTAHAVGSQELVWYTTSTTGFQAVEAATSLAKALAEGSGLGMELVEHVGVNSVYRGCVHPKGESERGCA